MSDYIYPGEERTALCISKHQINIPQNKYCVCTCYYTDVAYQRLKNYNCKLNIVCC